MAYRVRFVRAIRRATGAAWPAAEMRHGCPSWAVSFYLLVDFHPFTPVGLSSSHLHAARLAGYFGRAKLRGYMH